MFSLHSRRRTPVFRLLTKSFLTALLALCSAHAFAQSDRITFTGVWSTVAVSGLSSPTGITGDSAGNLYFTDSSLSSIVKLAPDGTQSTIGSGLNSPRGLAIDAAGNLYVTSNGDNKVYEITSGGVQTQVGSGWTGPINVAVDATGDIFVIDGAGLSEISAGSQSLLISSSTLQGLAVDSGNNIYYGDNSALGLYKIPAGATSASDVGFVNFVRNLFVDAQGAVYIAETAVGAQRHDDNNGDHTTFGDTPVTEAVWGNTKSLYLVDASGSVEKLALSAVDFGQVNVCRNGLSPAPCSLTRTLHFALDSILFSTNAARAVTQGITGLDYALTADSCTGTLVDGATCSVDVTFTPEAAGIRTGAAQNIGSSTLDLVAGPVGPHPRASHPRQAAHRLNQPSGSLLSSVFLSGVGVAPFGVFDTDPIQSYNYVPESNSFINGVTLDARGAVYVTDANNCVVQMRYSQTTTTVAGTTCGLSAGDGGPATAATLHTPLRTVIDGAGDLFIADFSDQSIRRVDGSTGIITTIAGNGTPAYSGDGGLAVNATLNRPSALALDAGGNLFIADQNNQAIRRIDAQTAIITTVAGTGTRGYSGDGGPAISAQLSYPLALAIDAAGSLYFADNGNNVIRKISSGIITTVAGNGTYGFSGDGGAATSAELADPEGVSVDLAGNVYIADSSNYVVRKVDATSGIISTVAGTYIGGTHADERYTGDGGPANHAGLSYVDDVFVDPYGELFIADSDNSVIRIAISPLGLASFGTVALGSASSTQNITFTNTGNSPLAISALPVPPNYSLASSTTCTAATTLAVNGSCLFGLQLVPTADGSLNSAFVFNDNFYNDANETQVIILSGVGIGAAPAQLAFAAALPAIVAGGNPGTVVVNVEASDSSLISTSAASISLTVTGPGGFSQTFTATAVNGVATFDLSSLALTAMGSYTFAATSTGLTPAQTSASVIANTPGPAQLAIPSSVTTVISAGANPGIVPVDIENASAVVVAGATNSVTLTLTGPGGYSHVVTVAASNGIAAFDLTGLALLTPGTYTLSATSTGLAPATATITVTAAISAPPVQLAIAGSLPAVVPSGANLGVVPVDLNNSSGRIVTAATNTVTLTISGPGGFSHVLVVSAVNGVASFDLSSLALNTTGDYTLTATSSGLVQAKATVTVTTGEVGTTPVALSIPPSVPATLASGAALGIVAVDIVNSSGSVIPGASNTVTLTITGPGGFLFTMTVTAVKGVASFDLSSTALTAPGVYTLTATSGHLTQALATVTVTTDFTIAVSNGSQGSIGPILPGGAATFSFTLAPASGAFPSSIALTVSGLPPGATFSFSPPSVTPGSNAVESALAIQTTRTAAALNPPPRSWWGFPGLALGLLLPVCISRRWRTAFRQKLLFSLALLLFSAGAVAGLAGCGAGGLFGHPQQSYTITVTGTSGSASHSATVTLSVQ